MQQEVEQVRLNGPKALESIYREYRHEFVRWASRHYHCDEDEAHEVFQQSVIAFYENVMEGKIVTLTSSLKTYLFSIGKNKIMELKRYQEKYVNTDGKEFVDRPDSSDEFRLEQLAETSVNQLPDPCRGLLIDYYYHRKSMRELALAYGYKNEDSVKNQKYRCMATLRKIFAELKLRSHE